MSAEGVSIDAAAAWGCVVAQRWSDGHWQRYWQRSAASCSLATRQLPSLSQPLSPSQHRHPHQVHYSLLLSQCSGLATRMG